MKQPRQSLVSVWSCHHLHCTSWYTKTTSTTLFLFIGYRQSFKCDIFTHNCARIRIACPFAWNVNETLCMQVSIKRIKMFGVLFSWSKTSSERPERFDLYMTSSYWPHLKLNISTMLIQHASEGQLHPIIYYQEKFELEGLLKENFLII